MKIKKNTPKSKGCIKCGNTKRDLRFGWCLPCFEKAQKARINNKKK